jgi:transposase
LIPIQKALLSQDTSLRTYLKEAGLDAAFVIRELFDQLDWSALEARYKPGGRPPYSPRRVVSLIIYGISQGTTSLRGLEQLARRDLVVLWLTGGLCPDHSTLGRFIGEHQEELHAVFEEMTKAMLSKLTEVNRDVAIDGSVIEAAASRFTQIKREALELWAQQTREAVEQNPDDSEKKSTPSTHNDALKPRSNGPKRGS